MKFGCYVHFHDVDALKNGTYYLEYPQGKNPPEFVRYINGDHCGDAKSVPDGLKCLKYPDARKLAKKS